MTNVEGLVGHKQATEVSDGDPDDFFHAAEIRAVKRCRVATAIKHAGDSIDGDLGTVDVGLCRLDECERCCRDDRMYGFHDDLPVCGRLDAPARRKDTPNLLLWRDQDDEWSPTRRPPIASAYS